MDEPPITPTQILIVTFALVLGFGALFCIVALRGLQWMLYRCGRCHREFRRAPHRRFPEHCPHCAARDWNLPVDPEAPR
jgi:hypothetical protein